MNLFWAPAINMTAAPYFESTRRFKTLALRAKNAAGLCKHEVVFTGRRAKSFPLREIRHDVSLSRSRRLRLSIPARLKERGGRANRRRYARWRRFPSDCRIETHSNMGAVVLCRNFSSGASCLVRFEQEKCVLPTAIARRRSISGRVMTNGLNNAAAKRLNDFSCSVAID
jgi:hypothetical protein